MENLEEEIDRLYALDPSAFTGARDGLARELRKAGGREEAELVRQLRKPSLSAWTINQLARQERRAVDLLLDAGHRLRDAQQGLLAGAEVGGLEEARRTEQGALAELRKAAARILSEVGRGSDTTLNRITETLQVAAVSSEGRELLARGRLTGDLEATGFDLFAPLTESGRQAKTRSRGGKPEPGRKRAAQEARQREQDRKRLEEARRRLHEAEATVKAATKKARAAQQDTAKARRQLEQAEERMREARAAATEAEKAAERARREVREADRKAR